MSHTDWVMASRLRIGLRQRWQLLFRDFDIVLCPPMPTAAFPHDHSARWERYLDIDGATVPYGDQIAWASIAILTGFPATAAPTGCRSACRSSAAISKTERRSPLPGCWKPPSAASVRRQYDGL